MPMTRSWMLHGGIPAALALLGWLCGAGRLLLEVSPPGEASTVVGTDCVRSEGQGRLHVFHRWTTRT